VQDVVAIRFLTFAADHTFAQLGATLILLVALLFSLIAVAWSVAFMNEGHARRRRSAPPLSSDLPEAVPQAVPGETAGAPADAKVEA
jgi:hypothetical protein